MTDPTLDPTLAWSRRKMERDAYDAAVQYMAADPFYVDKAISRREGALMRLAIRAFAEPEVTERATRAMQRLHGSSPTEEEAPR